ncbi:MAG: 4Fe-4S binding protein [candidate division Zixibacteria bacterium]|nr:4Fe-4S binding protein [candidate division Zixibacteria bacterium]
MDEIDNFTLNEVKSEKPTQKFRFYVQIFSVLINIWIGIEFYLFVSNIKSGGMLWDVPRPPGVEGWLPLGSLVSLRYWIESGIINNIHPSGMIIFIVILLTALFFKKAFCSWVCPVGFISEMLGNISDKIFKRRLLPPKWLDYILRSLKYIILLFFFYAILYQMSIRSIEAFVYSEYNIISDILMLRFFTHITTFALVVVLILFVLSLIIRGFWCRYLCPYGALLGILGLLSITRITRNKQSCTDCSSCANVCPAFISVDKVNQVNSDECIGCMACVDVCPVDKTLQISIVSKKKKVSSLKWAIVLVVFFWGSLWVAKMWGPWENSVTNEQYIDFMPQIEKGQFPHP